MKIKNFSRRQLLQNGAGTLPLTPFMSSNLLGQGAQNETNDPHFFLQVMFLGGLDTHYLFDARPLEMTTEKILQNYIGEEPREWIGRNGQSTLATRLTNPLRPFQDDLTVLNGVLMDTAFDGHDQNMAYWYTGNPFGGEFYIPHLNHHASYPLDFVETGPGKTAVNTSNSEKSVPVNKEAIRNMVESINSAPSLQKASPLFSFIGNRMTSILNGTAKLERGSFTNACSAMLTAFNGLPNLSTNIRGVSFDERASSGETLAYIDTISQQFKNGSEFTYQGFK